MRKCGAPGRHRAAAGAPAPPSRAGELLRAFPRAVCTAGAAAAWCRVGERGTRPARGRPAFQRLLGQRGLAQRRARCRSADQPGCPWAPRPRRAGAGAASAAQPGQSRSERRSHGHRPAPAPPSGLPAPLPTEGDSDRRFIKLESHADPSRPRAERIRGHRFNQAPPGAARRTHDREPGDMDYGWVVEARSGGRRAALAPPARGLARASGPPRAPAPA
jgi:hypothetical protein